MADEKKKATDYIAPGPRATVAAIKGEVDRAIAEGQYARALGASASQLYRVPNSVIGDVIGSAKPLLGGIARFAGGLLGTSNPGQVAAQSVPKAPAAARAWKPAAGMADKVAAASAGLQITPQERQLAFVDTLLRGPLTLREAQAATAMMPRPAKAATAKDTLLGQTAALSNQIAQAQIAAITNSDASDDEKKLAVQKTLEEKFARDGGLVGFNPVNLATAQMLSPDEAE